MSVPETDPTNVPAAKPLRPSWETVQPSPAVPVSRPGPLKPAYSAPPAPASAPSASYEPPPDPSGRYDLAGNLIPGSGPPAAAPPAPFIYSAGKAAPGVWPPPVGQGQDMAQANRNNSGEQSHLPPEIERLRWHWGAFFFPTYWTRRHGLRSVAFMIVGGLILLRVLRSLFGESNPAVFITLCALYVAACLGVKIYFGLNGHKIGWRNRHFPGGVEQYFQVQNRWMWWGFGINVFGTLLLLLVLLPVFLAARIGHSPSRPVSVYGSGYPGLSR